MVRFLSEKELYPVVLKESAKARNILWVCSPYLGWDAHHVFSPQIMKTPPRDIRFVFRLNNLSVKRGEVNPHEIEYFLEHFRNSSVKTNDNFHSKIYIFDNSALITSANLSKRAFERNIEVGVFLQHKQTEKVKDFFERLWDISERVDNLDNFKNEWNKTRTDRERIEDSSLKKAIKPHTKIQLWNEDTANKWFIHITGELPSKTEKAILADTHWSDQLHLIADLKPQTYESLRLGDIVYAFSTISKNKNVVEFEEGLVKDKRKIETEEGKYHLVHEALGKRKHSFSLNKGEFIQLKKRININKNDYEVLLNETQADILNKNLDAYRNVSSRENKKERVYKYLIQHPKQVFTYRDKKMQEDLTDIIPNTINRSIWALEKEKKIGKTQIKNRVYFGCHKAIKAHRQHGQRAWSDYA
jgi:hypothetical protein